MEVAFGADALALARELGEIKRVRSASRDGTIATRLFLDAWRDLAAGLPVACAMARSVCASLVAMRLGDLDRDALGGLGLSAAEAAAVRARALAAYADLLPAPLMRTLADGLDASAPGAAEAPPFAHLLAAQPRAGITAPGRARIVLEPQENHAEHCLAVAAIGVLLADGFGADPVPVWLAGLAHHLHNALMPDSGFAGEMLLGAHLAPAMAFATDRALDELPGALADAVREARRILPDADSPEGRAFHAADTLDRVWQIEQHLRPGALRLDRVLGEMELVHAGPIRPFQERVLEAAGLA